MQAAPAPFTFRDGERLIRFAPGALAEAPELLGQRGFDGYALLTTPRAEPDGPELVAGADAVLHVPSGGVPEAAAAVRAAVAGRPLVAFGGGRVVDAAKAIAGADRLVCAAIPTTLAGSSVTGIHRMPAGVEEWRLVRPALVVADPDLMTTLPDPELTATALNALAHACESLYVPGTNPVGEGAALRAAELFAASLAPGEAIDRPALALAAILGGYAIGVSGLAVHHAVCQTIVRTLGTPHAQTNTVMLPHSLRFVAPRAPEAIARLAAALGVPDAADGVAALAARAGVAALGDVGVGAGDVDAIVTDVLRHPGLWGTPGGAPTEAELAELVRAAL
jgi:alcohol dehydrogenase class IV